MKKLFILLTVLASIITTNTAQAWHDQAHMAIGRAAGFSGYHNCAAADVSHTVNRINNIKEGDNKSHFFDSADEVTTNDVYAQLDLIGEQTGEGHILGAILKATRDAKDRTAKGKFSDYYYAVLIHYCGDLSQPLHVAAYDDFNKKNHFKFDAALEDTTAAFAVEAVPALAAKLTVDKTVVFNSEEDVVNYVTYVANSAHNLSEQCKAENRVITYNEAVAQCSKSATLAHALLAYCSK